MTNKEYGYKEIEEGKPFLSIKDTSTRSGLSQYYIRQRCIDGTIPHRMLGNKYMIDYDAFLEREHLLAAQSCNPLSEAQ